MMATLSTAAEWMDGTLHGPDTTFSGVSIDSRTLGVGDLFFAIGGPNFDGHDFVAAVTRQGAAGVVVEREVPGSGSAILVADARRALGKLARHWRRRFSARTVALTGSNGKTTLKALITSICETQAKTLSTAGNLNNDLGVPLTLLRLRDEHVFAVIELGANHEGEIAYLTSLVEPDVVVVNNAGPAHLEGFGSMDGVARGKGEIFSGTPRPAVAVLNADDVYYDFWSARVTDVDTLTFGIESKADVFAKNIAVDADGSTFDLHLRDQSFPVRLSLPGRHNVMNACAAGAIGLALEIEPQAIASGLERAAAVGGRLREMTGCNNSRIYDDSYNANPASVRAAAEFLVASPGDNIVVLGDMFELGPDALEIHRAIGSELRELGVDALYAIGEQSRAAVDGFGAGARWFASQAALIDGLRASLTPESRVIVKGSRSMHMERVVDALTDRVEETA